MPTGEDSLEAPSVRKDVLYRATNPKEPAWRQGCVQENTVALQMLWS